MREHDEAGERAHTICTIFDSRLGCRRRRIRRRRRRRIRMMMRRRRIRRRRRRIMKVPVTFERGVLCGRIVINPPRVYVIKEGRVYVINP